jgi:hypothetical protein
MIRWACWNRRTAIKEMKAAAPSHATLSATMTKVVNDKWPLPISRSYCAKAGQRKLARASQAASGRGSAQKKGPTGEVGPWLLVSLKLSRALEPAPVAAAGEAEEAAAAEPGTLR